MPLNQLRHNNLVSLLGLLDSLPYCVPILLMEILHVELKKGGHIHVSRAVGIVGYFTSTRIFNTYIPYNVQIHSAAAQIDIELLWQRKSRFLLHVFHLLQIVAATYNQVLKLLFIIYSVKSSFISERLLHEVLAVAGIYGYVLASLFNNRSSCGMSGLD